MREFNASLDYTLDYHMIRYDLSDFGADGLLSDGYEVVLCYSTLFDAIKNIGYSGVNIQKTDMDIIKAVFRAKKETNTMGVVVHLSENIDIQLLEKICGVSLKKIEYKNAHELQSRLESEIASGCRTVVGGGLSQAIIQEYPGVSSFPVVPARYSFRLALERAKVIARIKRKERLRYDQLFSVLKAFGEGVIVIDENKDCIYKNQYALRILSVEHASNKQLKSYYAQLFLEEVLENGISVTEEQVCIHGRQILVSAIPLFIDTDRRGAVAFLRDVVSLYDLTGRIRASQKTSSTVSGGTVDDIRGTHPAMEKLKRLIAIYASHNASVLIHGETGTGKDLVAQALHNASERKKGPFWAINCAAIPESLLESELFGYAGGAFTGAKREGKAGMFEMAHGGTLFLDEVGDLSYGAQSRLLRVLETHEIIRVGGNHAIPVDLRVISASHKLLSHMVAEGRFRADLFYRLASLRLHVPSLRERMEDVPALLAPLLARYGKPPEIINQEILEEIRRHTWPGNIRELKSLVESYIILLGAGNHADPILFADVFKEWCQEQLQQPIRDSAAPFSLGGTLKERITLLRKQIVQETIVRCSWDKRRAAHELDISYGTLWRILSDG